ncbi:MAG: glycosyltransferase family A protein [Lentisphaeria bacterium]|nr:glycosyltransferase family A protein [Lentisphaeria bacterium]
MLHVPTLSSQFLSVIVIAYNEEKYLPQTLDSLSRQTDTRFEVIIVDSASTDATETVARAYADKLPSFHYLKLAKAMGPGFGRNRGAEAATGGRFLFLDADTVLTPTFLAETTAQLDRHRTDVATCPLRIQEKSALSDAGSLFLNTAMRLLNPFYACGYGACLFSTPAVHEAVGGFDERIGICEDCHYIKMARKKGFRFRILSKPFHTSDRRARHEGSTRIMAKYIGCHLRRMLTGREIYKEDITYNYGEF